MGSPLSDNVYQIFRTGGVGWNEEEQTCWRMMEKLHVSPARSLERISFFQSTLSVSISLYQGFTSTDCHRYMHTGTLACRLIRASLKTSIELRINSVWTKKTQKHLAFLWFPALLQEMKNPAITSYNFLHARCQENAFRLKTVTLIYRCPHRFTHSEFFSN